MTARTLLNGLLTFLAMVLSVPSAWAQLKCNLKYYSTEDGLSHDKVLCMTKDHEGFMWFGTWDGINRFDGHNFIAYKARPGDNSNIKNNKIRNIVEDKLGYLWVKTYDNLLYRFDKRTEKFWSLNDALSDGAPSPNFNINRIIPTSNGDTWLQTSDYGLMCVFADRSMAAPQITQFSERLTGDNEICSNKINFFYEDSQKRIWVGTRSGLVCLIKTNGKYHKIKLQNQTYYDTKLSFRCVTEHDGLLYFGTQQGKIIVYNGNLNIFSSRDVEVGAVVNALCFASSNRLYASTKGKGLAIVDPTSYYVTYASLATRDTYYSLFEDKSGLLWLEPEKTGVIKYDPHTNLFKQFNQKVDSNITGPHTSYQVFTGANGLVWINMRGGGFGYYDAEKDDVSYFYDEPGSVGQQFSNIITAYYADASGVLWLSGYEGGIHRAIFQPDNFTHNLLVNKPQNKTENEVRAIYQDNGGKLWIGTKANQLFVTKNGKKLNDVFTNMPAGGLGSVYTIIQGENGTLWFGTKGNGLFKAEQLPGNPDKYVLTQYMANQYDKNALSDNKVYAVLEDSKGRVWVGTFGHGLNLYNKAENTFKNSNNSFFNYPVGACNVIRYLQEDASGNIWVATTEGLVVFDPNKGTPDTYRFYRNYKIPGDAESLGNNDVQYIYKDRAGRMWLGTFGGGLQKLIAGTDISKKLRFKFYTTADGLPNDIVLGIVGDNRGNLWLTTENGLSKYNPKAGVFENYDYYDGLPNAKFSEAACIKLNNGEILLGCLNGYVSFDPDKVYNSRYSANMALTNMQIYNADVIPGAKDSPLQYPLDETDKVTLNYDQNLVSINYTILDYRDSHKILYAYKMDKLDANWNYVKTQHQATYTNLAPGKYIFRVKSASSDMFDNVPEKAIQITILPPPWLTVWAYIGYFILVVIAMEIARRIVFTMIRLRNRVVVEQKLTELKLQFFTNISHELKTPLTLIISPLAEISKTEKLSPMGREYINVVSKNANRMVRFINQLLDFRKAQSGKMRLKVSQIDIVALVKHVNQYFTEVAHEKKIELYVRSNVDHLLAWVDEEKLDIVIYNLLSNAFKFTAPNKKIIVEVAYTDGDECFYIKVIDQGPGVSKDKLTDIFELYYEGDNVETNNLKGSGIGLALSKELVLNHHGKITAKNNLDEGITFTIELKIGKEHFSDIQVDFVNPPQPQPGTHPLKADELQVLVTRIKPVEKHIPVLLIVEDNTDLRRFLSNQLSQSYQVIEAVDGVDGLKMATALLPDLIVSDVTMPNMNGIEMLDKLKNNIQTSHIPIILLTARTSVDNQIEGLKYGADFYITKPFNTDFVVACIENLIKQRKQLFDSIAGGNNVVQLSPGQVLITSKDEQLLKDAIRIVEEGMSDHNFNIDNVAEELALGRTTFYKKLKSLTGLAPVEFVRDIRLQRGEQLLSSGEFNISEIAYQIGFTSAGYFSTCFKEKYNLTPSQYLKREKEAKLHSDFK